MVTKKLIATLLMLISFVSCDSRKNIKKVKYYTTKNKIYNGNNDFTIQFNFPDTLYKDSIYKGAIFYKNVIDTVNTQQNDSITRKTDLFYKLGKNNLPIRDKELYVKNNLDTIFGFIKDSRTIFFSDRFNFTELGMNYINGVVVDSILIKSSTEKVRVIEMKYRVIHNVIVIDKPN